MGDTLPGERLSAVAKRRLLQENAASRPPSPVNRSESPTTFSVDHDEALAEVNSFDVLIDNGLGPLTREVGTISSQAVVVRLSKGAKTLVNGVYHVWVKKGAISINCAVLDTSSGLRTVYAPRSFNTPAILGHSIESAEFELHTASIELPDDSESKQTYFWAAPGGPLLPRSFIVHGLDSATIFPTLPNDFRPVELSLEPTADARASLNDWARSVYDMSTPMVLLSGVRTPGVSAHISCIINHLMSTPKVSGDKGLAYPRGVLLLDLDENVPEFGPPGTVSLVHIGEPILGPSYTHPAIWSPVADFLATNGILIQDWIDISANLLPQERAYWHILAEAVKHARNSKLPLLVKGWNWRRFSDPSCISAIIQEFKPTHVFSVSPTRETHLEDIIRITGSTTPARFHRISFPAGREPPLDQQHSMSLKSYFHGLPDSSNGTIDWYPAWSTFGPLSKTRKSLSYAQTTADMDCAGNITAIWPNVFVSGPLDRTLVGSLVAILAIPDAFCIPYGGDSTPNGYIFVSNSTDSEAKDPIRVIRDNDTGLPMVHGGQHIVQMQGCLGLGIIEGIDCKEAEIKFWSPVPRSLLQTCRSKGFNFHLRIIPRDAEGRNSTTWRRVYYT